MQSGDDTAESHENGHELDLLHDEILRREVGIPLSWLTLHTKGFEEAMRLACAVDRKLIDDPHGSSFTDQFHLDHHEETEAHTDATAAHRRHVMQVKPAPRETSFCAQLNKEREQQHEAVTDYTMGG